MPPKTNAARLLDQMEVRYELREYEVDPEDLAAEAVATKVGLPSEQLFKTLVALGDRQGICMAVIPANTELDLKALAAASGDRKIHLVPVKQLQKLTGYIRGGVTALAAKKTYPVYVDDTIELFRVISVSAGSRGTQILLAPGDFIRATKATVARLARAGGQKTLEHRSALDKPQEHATVFAQRFSRTYGLLHLIAYRVLGDEGKALLAIQKCQVTASRNPPRFESEGAFRSWLLRVLIDEALEILREGQRARQPAWFACHRGTDGTNEAR